MSIPGLILATVAGTSMASITQASCVDDQVKLQVLGAGGPELDDGRVSTSYLVWVEGRARVLVDAGGGSSANFEKSGAKVDDLQAVLFTHFHVDHSGDFPAYVKASFFTPRTEDLPVFGPAGNDRMPSTTGYLNNLFGPQGAYRYLSSYLDKQQSSKFKLVPHDVNLKTAQPTEYKVNATLGVSAIPVHHGPIAAVAWRVYAGQCSITFSGDMNNQTGKLRHLAQGSDLLVAHNAVPEDAEGIARNLHMPPSEIGRIAGEAKVKKLLISHRMKRTSGTAQEKMTRSEVGKFYTGPVVFAEDLDIFELK